MITLKLIVGLFAIIFGIPNMIIDHKHRKRRAYQPGNAWGYYAKLSREGNWEGKFMMWSGYAGIALIIASLVYLFYALSR